ncbi:MAG: fused MFS/spermidine synthase [Polyangiales bacterium]
MRRLFTATTLLGSALLFAVQPMVARALLPRVGGVPALWNTCSVFFQLGLLAGYAWAHALPTRPGPRAMAALHVALLALAATTLPFALGDLSPPSGDPTGAILAALAQRVAPMFVLLSAGSPLLQRWYLGASKRDASPLIAASNVGSLAALLAYPLVIEPTLPLAAQGRAFAAAFVVYVIAVAACAFAARRESPAAVEHRAPATSIGLRAWLRLAALAFVPSSMMLGLTAHIATDVGSFPLLWVGPLAVYLASFIVVFARPPKPPTARLVTPFLGLLVLVFLFSAPQVATRIPLVAGHFALFAACAYILHGELARARPADASITSYQLAIAVGGALGGAFNALVAPWIFTRVTEYPLTLALAVLLLPKPPPPPDPRAREEALLRSVGLDPETVLGPPPTRVPARSKTPGDALVPLVVGAVAAALFAAPLRASTPSLGRYGLPLALLVLLSLGRRARLALGLMAILAASRFDRSVLVESRTFYGVLRVEEARGVRRFLHGTTLHGMQFRSPKMRGRPVAYYDTTAPIGELMRALGPSLDDRRVAVVGLGVGMLAAYARPRQRWTFYELDPEVDRIARAWFTWLRDAAAPWSVVTGDARRSLERDASARYGLLALDAFSSDAIPTHLLTREAISLYLSRLDARGVLAFHITNRHVDLGPVLSALARDRRLVALTRTGAGFGPEGPVRSTWVVMARRSEDLGALSNWTPLDATTRRPWTDDFSNALSALRLR